MAAFSGVEAACFPGYMAKLEDDVKGYDCSLPAARDHRHKRRFSVLCRLFDLALADQPAPASNCHCLYAVVAVQLCVDVAQMRADRAVRDEKFFGHCRI